MKLDSKQWSMNTLSIWWVVTCRFYEGRKIRFMGDSGLDDQKMLPQVVKLGQEFIYRVSHLEQIVVEVYDDRLHRWETKKLQGLTKGVPYQATLQVLFKHAEQTRLDTIHIGSFQIRIPGT